MSDMKTNLHSDIKAPKGAKIAIAVSEYNADITQVLLKSCQEELVIRGVLTKNISVVNAPGSFELPYVCKQLADAGGFDAIIALGAVVRGETPHFDYIAFAAAHGIMEVGLANKVPVIFGVLTTENPKQAKARIQGGNRGDKGVEAAITALKMIHLNS